MCNSSNIDFRTLVLILGLSISLPGFAQIEEVIVTAQKREESMQDVPIAITAFSGEDLRQDDISSLEEISNRTPGLLYTPFSNAQPEIAIRGIGTKEDGPAANDSTVVSVDDVYIAARIAQIFDIYDLERVEVLRGPQGTLYGRNSIAGSINFVTSKPDENFKLHAEQTFGRFDQIDTRALVSGPISEDNGLYGKISFSRRKNDGFVDHLNTAGQKIGELDGIETISARTQIRWEPNDRFESYLTFDMAFDDNPGRNREPVGTTLPPVPGLNPVLANETLGGTSPFNAFNEDPGFLEREIYGLSLKMTYEFDNFSLTSITAYRKAEMDLNLDCCGLPASVFGFSVLAPTEEEASQLTQEIRLSGSTDSIDWVAGFFVTDEDDERSESFIFRGLPLLGLPVTLNTNTSHEDADIFAWALFGQLTWRWTENFTVTFGTRYSYEEKDFFAEGITSGTPFPVPIIIGAFAPVTAKADWDSIDFRLAVDYAPTDNLLVYSSFSTGFKSGGFTGSASTAQRAVTPFKNENVQNWEFGIKSQWLNNTLQANVTAFIANYEDLQVTRFAATAASPRFGEFLTENADEADLKGIEFEGLWLPTEAIKISMFYAFLDTEYGSFTSATPTPGGALPDFSGNQLRQAPEHTGGISGQYTWQLSGGASLVAKLSARYQDKVYFDPDNKEISATQDYTLMDGRLTYTSGSGRWGLSLWSKNLGDEEYFSHIFTLGDNRAFARVGTPRTYGVTLSLSYD